MKNWKTILLSITILLGVTLEIFKVAVRSGQPHSNIIHQELEGMDLRPFSRSKQERLNDKQGLQMRAFKTKLKKAAVCCVAKKYKQDEKPIYAHQFDESGKKKKTTKKTTKKVVKKDKKKVDKEESADKIKKEKQPEVSSKKDDLQDRLANNTTPNIPLSNNMIPAEPGYQEATPMEPGIQEKEDSHSVPQTFEAWEALVIQVSSFENTSFLIRSYISGNLKDPSVFFSVVDAMINSSNEKVYKNGLRALSASINKAPNHQSFSLLIKIIENHSIGTRERKNAEEILKGNYTSIQHLNTLRFILNSSSSEFEVSKAIQMIQLSAQKNLRITQTDPYPEIGTQESEPTIISPIFQIKNYQEILEDLEKFVNETSENSQLNAEANKVAQSIKKLISKITHLTHVQDTLTTTKG